MNYALVFMSCCTCWGVTVSSSSITIGDFTSMGGAFGQFQETERGHYLSTSNDPVSCMHALINGTWYK